MNWAVKNWASGRETERFGTGETRGYSIAAVPWSMHERNEVVIRKQDKIEVDNQQRLGCRRATAPSVSSASKNPQADRSNRRCAQAKVSLPNHAMTPAVETVQPQGCVLVENQSSYTLTAPGCLQTVRENDADDMVCWTRCTRQCQLECQLVVLEARRTMEQMVYFLGPQTTTRRFPDCARKEECR